jgi:DNA repair photolyase
VTLFLSPVLPGITDGEEALGAVVAAASEAGARFVQGGALRLGSELKDDFIEAIGREVPGMGAQYRWFYGTATNAPAGYQIKLERKIASARREAVLDHQILREMPAPASRRRQLALPI